MMLVFLAFESMYLFACISHLTLASCVFSCCSLSFCIHQPFHFGLLRFLLLFFIFLHASAISLWPLAFFLLFSIFLRALDISFWPFAFSLVVLYLFTCSNHLTLASCVFSCCSLSFCMHQPSHFGLLHFLVLFSIILRASTISLWPLAFSPLVLCLFMCINHLPLASCIFSSCFLSFYVHQPSSFGLLHFLLLFFIFLRASTISLWPLAFSPIVLYLFTCINHLALASCIFSYCSLSFYVHQPSRLASCIFSYCSLSFCMQ